MQRASAGIINGVLYLAGEHIGAWHHICERIVRHGGRAGVLEADAPVDRVGRHNGIGIGCRGAVVCIAFGVFGDTRHNAAPPQRHAGDQPAGLTSTGKAVLLPYRVGTLHQAVAVIGVSIAGGCYGTDRYIVLADLGDAGGQVIRVGHGHRIDRRILRIPRSAHAGSVAEHQCFAPVKVILLPFGIVFQRVLPGTG